jgi:hypothetical protein
VTSPDGQLRVNLDQLAQTVVQWKQSADGMRGGAPPPVTTQGWPTGTMTVAIHAGAEQTTASLQDGMVGSADGLSNSANSFQQADHASGMKMADITGPLGDILGAITGVVGTGTGAVGSLGGVLSSLISTTLSSALKGGSGGKDQGPQQNQNPNNYDNGGDYGSRLVSDDFT